MYNSIRTLCALACFAGLGEGVSAMSPWQDAAPESSPASFQELPPIGYSTPQEMLLEMRGLADESGLVSLQEIGKSYLGTPLTMVTVSRGRKAQPSKEVLIVANLEGDRPVASEVAMGLIRHLAQGNSPMLGAAKVHVMPMANPDAAQNALESGFPWRGAPVDRDRDGGLDEDGPMDLDGDGKVLWLRVPSTSGEWHASSTDPRCSVKAKDVREHPGAFHLRREGIDVDGDREFSEDGPGGVQVDANFAHRWKQYAPEAGPYPLSESESRALAKFLIDHPRIACVLVLDDEDNLSKTPKGSDKVGIDSTDPMEADAALVSVLGKRLKPAEDGAAKSKIDDTDDFSLETIQEAMETAPDMSGTAERVEVVSEPAKASPKWTAPRSADHGAGNFADWAYYQRGVFVLESAVWSPSLDSKDLAGEALPKDATDEEKLLAWADSVYGTSHFKPWTPINHKDLGSIEVGGLMPLVLTNPPATALPSLVEHYAGFVDSLADDLARIEWSEVTFTALDDQGVYEVRAKLVNRGRFATVPAMGRKNRVPLPIRVELKLPDAGQLIVGQLKNSAARLEGFGGHQDYHWIIRVPVGAGKPKLIARSETAGHAELTLEVK